MKQIKMSGELVLAPFFYFVLIPNIIYEFMELRT
jgi:hypothetical protein